MKPDARPLRSDSGMTLIEVLVALALLVGVVVTITGGLQLGRRVWERGKTEEASIALDAAVRAVSSVLAATFPAAVTGRDGAPQLVFQGTKDNCRFVFLSTGEGLPGGLIFGEIGVPQTAQLSPLTLWSSVFRAETIVRQTRASMLATVVLPLPSQIEFAYAGFDERGQPTGWLPSWSGARELPHLVQFKINVRSNGREETATGVAQLRQR